MGVIPLRAAGDRRVHKRVDIFGSAEVVEGDPRGQSEREQSVRTHLQRVRSSDPTRLTVLGLVNDDLTIPQYQQNSAAFFDTDSCYLETCPQVYNTFGVQATYRTQKGCQVLLDDDCPEDEICDDGIDNDLDGYIDYYDENCECDENLFNAQCESECVNTLFQPIAMRLKWKSDFLNSGTFYSIH